MSIEAITVIITRNGFSITAFGAEGSCNIIKEEYLRDEHGILGCAAGNFEEEPVVNQNEELLEALCSLVDPATDAFRAITT